MGKIAGHPQASDTSPCPRTPPSHAEAAGLGDVGVGSGGHPWSPDGLLASPAL